MSRGTPRRPGRLGLRFRVYLLVSIGVLAPAALVSAMFWTRLREVDAAALAERRAAAVAAGERVDEELTADLETLQRLASAPAMAPAAAGDPLRADEAREVLRGAAVHAQFHVLFLVDAAGRVAAEEGRAARGAAPPASLPELQQALRDRRPRVAAVAGAGQRAWALVPVIDWRGQPAGVVGAVIDLAEPERARILEHALGGRGGHADLVDRDGTVVASTDGGRVGGRADCARLWRAPPPRAESGRCRDCHVTGPSQVSTAAPVARAAWVVSAVQPEEAVLASGGGLSTSFGLFATTLVAVAFVFAWGAARSVTGPVAKLTAAAERVAAGAPGALDAPIPALGEDELGRLGRSVENMRASLRDLIARVEGANEALERRVAERTAELARANAQLRERDLHRQQLLRTVITAQEDERKRIARELHDETTQSLAVLAMGIESAAAALRAGGPQPRLDEVKALAVRTLEEVHRLILDLRPAVLDDLGLFSAVRWYAERYLAARGLAVRCEIGELERRLPPEVEIAVFRMGQEAMNNIARHARAESVLIQLSAEDGALRLEIEDDGQGFDPGQAKDDRPHYGLLGIRERAELLGGSAEIQSSPGNGTRVVIRVPIPAEDPGGPASHGPAAPVSSESP